MDELNKLWREISDKNWRTELDEAPPLERPFSPTSQNMMAEMTRKVLYKVWFIIGFILLYGVWAVIAIDGNREIMLLIAAMLLFGLFNLWLVLPPYLRMKKQVGLMSGNLKEVLHFYHEQLHGIVRRENIIGGVFTPIAAMLGFSFAIIEEKGSFLFIWERPWLLATMLVTGLLVGALGAWMTVWLNRKAFGKYLNYLKENLKQLEENE